jgi:MATE family multidrug resistance protein
VVVAQSLRARADVLVPSLTHLASYTLVMVPLGWFFAVARHGGVNGFVWAIIIGSFLSAGLLLARFRMLARRD